MSLDSLFAVYQEAGHADYIGECVSQREHMQQAAWLARKAGADDALILGAFFHDIGHLVAPESAPQMEGLGVLDHELIGAQRLREWGFPDRVADLVELHVQAKRYLCFSKPGYAQTLSQASLGEQNPESGKDYKSLECNRLGWKGFHVRGQTGKRRGNVGVLQGWPALYLSCGCLTGPVSSRCVGDGTADSPDFTIFWGLFILPTGICLVSIVGL